MIEFKIAIDPKNDSNPHNLDSAVDILINEIENLSGVIVEKEVAKRIGSRGAYLDISSVIVKAIELGIFAGIYTAIIDFYDRCKNAEVTLHFENGNSVVIKGLSQKEALKLIDEYSKSKKDDE